MVAAQGARDIQIPGVGLSFLFGRLRLGVLVGEAAQAQRELAQLVEQRDLLGDARIDLERRGLGFLVVLVLAGLVAGLRAHGDDPDVAQHGLADPTARRTIGRRQGLGQDEIDAVARKDQTGVARRRVDRQRDRAHAGRQDRGEEAPLAGLDDAAVGDREALRDAAPDHRANHHVLAAHALEHVGVRDIVGRPALPAQMLRLDEGAGRKKGVGDQHLVDRYGCRCGDRGDVVLLAFDPAARVHGRRASDDHGNKQDDDATQAHRGFLRVLSVERRQRGPRRRWRRRREAWGRGRDRGRGDDIAALGACLGAGLGRVARDVLRAGRRKIPAERGQVGVDHAMPAPVPEDAERQAAADEAGDQREQREVVEARPQGAAQRSA